MYKILETYLPAYLPLFFLLAPHNQMSGLKVNNNVLAKFSTTHLLVKMIINFMNYLDSNDLQVFSKLRFQITKHGRDTRALIVLLGFDIVPYSSLFQYFLWIYYSNVPIN